MKIKATLFLFFVFTMTSFAQSNCQDLRGCERKLCELKTKLEYAKQYNRKGQIRGLENAISNIERKCEPGNFNYSSDTEKKIKDKEKKVRERTFDLNEAIRENQKTSKIEKKRQKLEEAKRELEAAKREK